MASGSFTGTTSNDKIIPKITWSSKQNIEGNYSDVTVTLTYSRTNSGYTTSGRFSGSITIDGTKTTDSLDVNEAQISITYNSNTFAMKATKRVHHNDDGSKKITISATGSLSGESSLTYTKISDEVTLDTIPRAATLTSAPNFNDHDNPVIQYSNPAGNSATSLMACISLNGVKIDIAYRDVTKTGTSYTFNLTEAERDILRKATSSSSRKLYFYLRTKFGTTKYYSTKEVTFSVVDDQDSKPSIKMTATLDNSSLPSEFKDMCIQGKSRYGVNLSAEGKYGAKIASLYAVADGATYNLASFKTNVFNKSENVNIVGHVKDTRGFTNSTKKIISVIPYSKPLVIPLENQNAIMCYRSDGNGVRIGNSTSVWIKAKRNYYSVEGKNQCALQWRRKPTNEPWNDSVHQWSDLIPKTDVSTDEYNALLSGVDFETKKSYTMQIRAIDDIGEYDIKTFDIPTEDVALHLGKGGKNVSVGAYCDYSKQYTFYSEWDAYFNNEVYVKDQKLEEFIKNVVNNM